jgi:DNA-binding NarL/FixJ family response regulator
VLLLTAAETDAGILEALRAGATGLIAKDSDAGELVRAVRAVAQGDALLSPRLMNRVIAQFVSLAPRSGPIPEALAELTPREREVMALVAAGLSNDEIAQRLVVSPATAKTHVSRVLRKLAARDRAQLVVLAYETGLVAARQDTTNDDNHAGPA